MAALLTIGCLGMWCAWAALLLGGKLRPAQPDPERGTPWAWWTLFGIGEGLVAWAVVWQAAGNGRLGAEMLRVGAALGAAVAICAVGWRTLAPAQRQLVLLAGLAPAGIMAVVTGLLEGAAGFEAACRLGLVLPGGMLAGLALWRTNRPASVAVLIYAVVAGLIVCHAPFFPASCLNEQSVRADLGIPAQLVRAVCSLAVLAAAWAERRGSLVTPANAATGSRHWLLPSALLLLAAIAWGATHGGRMAIVGADLDGDSQGETEMVALATGSASGHPADAEPGAARLEKIVSQRLRYGLPALAALFVALGCVGVLLVRRAQ